MKDTFISDANINHEIENAVGGEFEKKFLANFPNYTKETLYELIHTTARNIKARNDTETMSIKVKEKMQKDKKIELLNEKEYKRTVVNSYGAKRLNAMVIYADNRDEYKLCLFYKIEENELMLDDYVIEKGAVLGF